MTRVDYDRRLYRAYRAGRRLSADAGRLWMDALARHADGAFDFALLSMVIHHVPDLDGCARELGRGRQAGRAHLHPEHVQRPARRHPPLEFFPSARAIDAARLPRVGRVREAFEARGFSMVALDTIEQEIDPSLAAHYERIERRALSSFELMSDAEFERGLALMRDAIQREADPIPVREKVDLLVLRRSRDQLPG